MSSISLLIDGYNLLHASGILGHAGEHDALLGGKGRLELVDQQLVSVDAEHGQRKSHRTDQRQHDAQAKRAKHQDKLAKHGGDRLGEIGASGAQQRRPEGPR